ncbi:uncharacterized protein RCC_07756 [Ramularia collo-cygni]|uniref:Uncharacterized protein n=1 Tax=Ramularia collo-cygni TaxID=112498 RepID=A0A2D3V8X3_9PEZI|nr:uncharacterized protein RCC_07756 [Ramularia collo-cygni]CZT21890.1 uncharacterized protein RCC_07756 [Ramularia collo-cygni]
MQYKYLAATVLALLGSASAWAPMGDRGQSCPDTWIQCYTCDGEGGQRGHCGPRSEYSGCGCIDDGGWGGDNHGGQGRNWGNNEDRNGGQGRNWGNNDGRNNW